MVNTILCVDDDDTMRFLVSRVLEGAGYAVTACEDGPAALDCVNERDFDLVVLDLEMPAMSGFEVCRALKNNPFTSHVPILMLTAQSDIEHKEEGFEAGADEYLAKPFEARELIMRVAALLRLVRREGDRNPSSRLPGGRAIHEEIARRAAGSAPFAVCYIDLDYFKPFADTFGFATADIIIQETGNALRRAVARAGNEHDFVGHIGGDDFIVVTTREHAEALAHQCAVQFRQSVHEVLGEDVAARGWFTGTDREGNKRKFPLATLSTAVVVIDPAQGVPTGYIGAVAADVKRNAKSCGPGTILVQAIA